jgi:osmotically-inducible protein OsmY
MRVFNICAFTAVVLCAAVAAQGEDTIGQKIGRTVDQAVNQVQLGFEEARNTVNRLSIEGRVYARLHWDKALQDASISVEAGKDGAATLRGTVPSESAKAKAEQLTNDTIGVERVANELQIHPASIK